MPEDRYDVAIVGASIAGSTAAIFFARHGLRVALVERNPNPETFKRLCTHVILSSAVPTIERLGLAELIERSGGIRNGAEFWTRWGWIRPPDTPEDPRPYGYNFRRQKLDPLLRGMAFQSPGVDYFSGESAHSLIEQGGRAIGIELHTPAHGSRQLGAQLIVGADGRHSQVARCANLPCSAKPNHRLAFWAYFCDLPLASGNTSQVWFLEPDAAYAFPNDEGITLLGCMPYKDRTAEFKNDLEGSFQRFFAALPSGPQISRARRVSSFFSLLENPNISRRTSKPGLALIGDAALASDPVWGVGCGWAFQSAEWIVEHTADALKTGDSGQLDLALTRYSKAHRSALAGHHALICSFSARKKFNLLERLFFSAAVHDPVTARHFDSFGNRRMSVSAFLSPRAVWRAARVAAWERS
jgi:2-polyprenyl-6-methoxyphenol hydroxylase-like FAD-dependent oxidoreductase